MFVDILPRWERYAYWIIGLAVIGYSFYVLYKEGNEIQNELDERHFVDGWGWIGRKQDRRDKEWWQWRERLWTMLPLYLIHVILSMASFYIRVSEKARLCLLLMFDMSAVVFYLGFKPVLFLLCQIVITYLVTFTGSIILVWLLVITIVVTSNLRFSYPFQISILGLDCDAKYQYMVSSALVCARLISFASEKIKSRKQKAKHPNNHTNFTKHFGPGEKSAADISELSMHKPLRSYACSCDIKYSTAEDHSRNRSGRLQNDPDLLEFMFYSFYFPLFLDGPIIIYNDFHNQIRANFKSNVFSVDVFDIFKRLMRLAFWAFFIDFQFHFLYYCSIGTSIAVINRISLWSVLMLGFGYGNFFMMKYLCMYGLSLQVSRFDGVMPIPLPRCIGWVYSYTDMWKHFDVGLYNFVKHHIYIPLGGSRAGFARQVLGLGIAFLSIFWWHGGSRSIFIWCTGNFVIGSLQACVPILERSSLGVKVKSFLNPSVRLRLKAMCIVPVYITSSVWILFFFYGTTVGKIFFQRMVTRAPWHELIIEYCCFVVCIQNAMYLHARHQAKHHKR